MCIKTKSLQCLRLGSHICGRGFSAAVRRGSVHRFRYEFLPEITPEPDPKLHRILFKTAPRPPCTCVNRLQGKPVRFTCYANWILLKTHPYVWTEPQFFFLQQLWPEWKSGLIAEVPHTPYLSQIYSSAIQKINAPTGELWHSRGSAGPLWREDQGCHRLFYSGLFIF